MGAKKKVETKRIDSGPSDADIMKERELVGKFTSAASRLSYTGTFICILGFTWFLNRVGWHNLLGKAVRSRQETFGQRVDVHLPTFCLWLGIFLRSAESWAGLKAESTTPQFSFAQFAGKFAGYVVASGLCVVAAVFAYLGILDSTAPKAEVFEPTTSFLVALLTGAPGVFLILSTLKVTAPVKTYVTAIDSSIAVAFARLVCLIAAVFLLYLAFLRGVSLAAGEYCEEFKSMSSGGFCNALGFITQCTMTICGTLFTGVAVGSTLTGKPGRADVPALNGALGSILFGSVVLFMGEFASPPPEYHLLTGAVVLAAMTLLVLCTPLLGAAEGGSNPFYASTVQAVNKFIKDVQSAGKVDCAFGTE